MRVLAINSSPRAEKQSKTELMLGHFVQGMLTAGADVDIVHLRNQPDNQCIGCFTCWSKTPGVCIYDDSIRDDVFQKWLAADLVVYASPLYFYTMNATLKAFIERTLPALQPFVDEHDGRTFHAPRQQPPDVVMLSVAGLPEPSVFDLLSQYVRFLFGDRLLAEIYRGASEMMVQPGVKVYLDEILDATRQAGYELVRERCVQDATLTRITQPIVDDGLYRELVNDSWTYLIEQQMTPREWELQRARQSKHKGDLP